MTPCFLFPEFHFIQSCQDWDEFQFLWGPAYPAEAGISETTSDWSLSDGKMRIWKDKILHYSSTFKRNSSQRKHRWTCEQKRQFHDDPTAASSKDPRLFCRPIHFALLISWLFLKASINKMDWSGPIKNKVLPRKHKSFDIYIYGWVNNTKIDSVYLEWQI